MEEVPSSLPPSTREPEKRQSATFHGTLFRLRKIGKTEALAPVGIIRYRFHRAELHLDLTAGTGKQMPHTVGGTADWVRSGW
jgi:hypothetical protein